MTELIKEQYFPPKKKKNDTKMPTEISVQKFFIQTTAHGQLNKLG